jgi:hypothetical protein
MIRRPVEVVAAWAAEPEDAPIWYDSLNTVKWKTPPSLRVGRRVALRVAGRGSPSWPGASAGVRPVTATPRARFGAITHNLGGGLGHHSGTLGNRGDPSIAAVRQTRLDRHSIVACDDAA